jgi:putative oxidoreductase
MHNFPVAALAGRILLALLFVLAGLVKALGPKPYLDHMAQHRLPSVLIIGVIALEFGAGAALLVGWQARYAAAALAGFCVLTALIFHTRFSDRAERTAFIKDLAICGGLLLIAAG